jgi:predicted ATP-dependent protease
MSHIKTISANQLRSFCDLGEFNFISTNDLPDFIGVVGQDRAVEALSFALEIDHAGYNMYLKGPSGLGKHTLLSQLLDKACANKDAADDWCYVFNFKDPLMPNAIRLAAGQGVAFRDDMQHFIADLDSALQNLFSEEKNVNRENLQYDDILKLIQKLEKKYSAVKGVLDYLFEIKKEIINSLSAFCVGPHSQMTYEECIDVLGLQNYEVNVIVKHSHESNAPVIVENDPTVQNLFGQIEYVSQMGSLLTDFHYIKSGALHRANGGYLVIDADKLLQDPIAWKTLKQALIKKQIKIPAAETNTGNVNLVSMNPEVIPLSVKVILVGSRSLYSILFDEDSDFSELFKVEVDFSETVACTKKSLNQYAQVIATLARKNNLLAFEQDAVKFIIEYGMRQIEDSTLLFTHMHSILELLVESDFWAKKSGQTIIRVKDVNLAVEKQVYRADRNREQIYDEINKGTILIDVSGEKIASVNGLFVIETGRLEFAQPARITATVRIGDGEIIDIEREVDLGGPLHSKGVLILSSYLGSHYATGKPLSISASLAFEQSYGSVDGDSATVGELCALLSAIAKVPIKQSLAITGSANQHGNVQAIGGINEKIEGFFDICLLKGLTGEQGVILPATNIAHLVLRDDVVDAIEKNQFSLYPISTVDEAISILTGMSAGKRNEQGEFPEDSVNFKVEQCLLELAELKHEDHNKDEHDVHNKDEHDDHDKDDDEKEPKKT